MEKQIIAELKRIADALERAYPPPKDLFIPQLERDRNKMEVLVPGSTDVKFLSKNDNKDTEII